MNNLKKIEKERFSEVREKALLEREEGMKEEMNSLRHAPIEKRIDFLREVPGAKGAIIDDLLADIKALQEGKGGLASVSTPVTQSVKGNRKKQSRLFLGLILGLVLGITGGGVSVWLVMQGDLLTNTEQTQEKATIVNLDQSSRWNSKEEEDFYLSISRANGGLALAKHCSNEGRVEVEIAGLRRDACLIWPPAE